MRHRLMIGVPVALLLAFSIMAGPAAYAQRETVLPTDSVLKVKLDNRLSSRNSQPGDRVTATVTGQGSGYDLPAGTRVEGQVTDVQPATSHRPGSLAVDFTALRLPDGQTYQIAGSPISLDSHSVQRNSNGLLVAKPGSRNNKMKFLAYGAGAGFLIGSLLGSNIKGALAGALAGYLYGQYHKSKANGRDVVLNPGTEFGVRLDRQVAIAPTSRYGYQSRVEGYRSSYSQSYRGSQPSTTYSRRDPSLQYSRQDVRVLLNGQPVPFGSVLPIRSGSQVLVPVVPVLTTVSADFNFDRSGRSVTLTGPHNVRLTAGSRYATVDGRRVKLSEPTRIVDGWLYAPPGFFHYALDMQTHWDPSDGTLTLTPLPGR